MNIDIDTQAKILSDLNRLLETKAFTVKGGLKDIASLLKKSPTIKGDKNEEQGVTKLWNAISEICQSRTTHEYSLSGLRNFFSTSNVFGSGRDPIADLIYQAIAQAEVNHQVSGQNITDLTGLLNTQQKRQAQKEFKKFDEKLASDIACHLNQPNLPLDTLIQDEYQFSVSLSPPKKEDDIPKGKSIVFSKENNESDSFHTYYIKNGKFEKIPVNLNELPEEVGKIYNYLKTKQELDVLNKEITCRSNMSESLTAGRREGQRWYKLIDFMVYHQKQDACLKRKQKLEEENENQKSDLNKLGVLGIDNDFNIDIEEDKGSSYDKIVKKCYPAIHLVSNRLTANENLQKSFIFKQITRVAEKLYSILKNNELITQQVIPLVEGRLEGGSVRPIVHI